MEQRRAEYPVSRLAIVQTTDLIYIFCAAAWVGMALELNSHALTLWLGLLLACSFCLIPVEFHTGVLWQRVVALFADSENQKVETVKHTSLIILVEIMRVFSLTMTFLKLGIPVCLHEAETPNVSMQAPAYACFIGMFLILSNIWNNVNFLGKIFVLPGLDNDYHTLFEKYYNKTEGTKPAKGRHLAYRFSISAFQWINFFLYGYVFPIIGWGIVILSAICFHNQEALRTYLAPYLAFSTMTFFLVQATIKVIHVVLISSMIVEVERDHR